MVYMKEKDDKGLIIVHTGDGKGKTTAAIGMAFRGAGHKLKSLIIQFIKGSWKYGELEAAKNMSQWLDIIPMGKGFIRLDKDGPDIDDEKAIAHAWDFFSEKMASKEYDMIILDEINYVISYDLIKVETLIKALKDKPENLHIVLTGRDVHPEIIKIADLVTEMKEIKHPFKNGIKAQKGVEF